MDGWTRGFKYVLLEVSGFLKSFSSNYLFSLGIVRSNQFTFLDCSSNFRHSIPKLLYSVLNSPQDILSGPPIRIPTILSLNLKK